MIVFKIFYIFIELFLEIQNKELKIQNSIISKFRSKGLILEFLFLQIYSPNLK